MSTTDELHKVLRQKHSSHQERLRAIAGAVITDLGLPESARPHVKMAVDAAFDVGHRTTTTDDWCDL